jgi:hypothetical protein
MKKARWLAHPPWWIVLLREAAGARVPFEPLEEGMR